MTIPFMHQSPYASFGTELLRDIALFVEVARTRSFTRAAENLNMPASTLSRRIGVLERQIGLRLLNRTTRRVEVTDAGAAYHAKCGHLVDAARLAHEEVLGLQRAVQGTLRMTCSPDFANHYLPALLATFLRQHPQMRVELDLSSRVVDLISENVDMALRLGPLANSALIARRIGYFHAALYASPKYLRQTHALRTPRDLSRHACLQRGDSVSDTVWHLIPTGAPRTPAYSESQKRSIKINGPVIATSVVMIRQLAVEGLGIAAIDEGMAAADVKAGRLVRVLPRWQLMPVPLHVLTPSRLLPARVRAFIDCLLQAFPQAPGHVVLSERVGK